MSSRLGTVLVLLLCTLCVCDAYSFVSSFFHKLPAPALPGSNKHRSNVIRMQDESSRRRLLFYSAAAATTSFGFLGQPDPVSADVQLQYGSGSFSGKSVVNGVLSAYGLPQFPDTKGYTPFLQQFKETVVEFKYPSNWVVNNKAKFADSGLKRGQTGITVSDYRTAEGLTLFTLPVDAKTIDQVDTKSVADLVVDGGKTSGSGTSGYKLLKESNLSEEGYKTYTFAWDSITVSGYEVERYGVAAATVKGGNLYALFGVVTKPRAKAMAPIFKEIAESFRVFKI